MFHSNRNNVRNVRSNGMANIRILVFILSNTNNKIYYLCLFYQQNFQNKSSILNKNTIKNRFSNQRRIQTQIRGGAEIISGGAAEGRDYIRVGAEGAGGGARAPLGSATVSNQLFVANSKYFCVCYSSVFINKFLQRNYKKNRFRLYIYL